MKMDFAKEFDIVDWDFLVEPLDVYGFSSKWIGWIKTIFLLSLKANFLVNGVQRGYVGYLRGLR